MNKLNINYIINYTKENSDCQCLSNEYKSSQELLTFQCSQGHVFEMNWNNFQQGKRCPKCAAINKGLKKRNQHIIKNNITYKRCTKCHIEKILDEYHIDNRQWDKLNLCCKECHNKITFESAHNNPNSRLKASRKCQYKKKYGLTLEKYEIILQQQDYKCKICGATCSINKKSNILYVDHDHKNNKIRGLLCKNCNNLLGYAKDNMEILSQAIKYLEENLD